LCCEREKEKEKAWKRMMLINTHNQIIIIEGNGDVDQQTQTNHHY